MVGGSALDVVPRSGGRSGLSGGKVVTPDLGSPTAPLPVIVSTPNRQSLFGEVHSSASAEIEHLGGSHQ